MKCWNLNYHEPVCFSFGLFIRKIWMIAQKTRFDVNFLNVNFEFFTKY